MTTWVPGVQRLPVVRSSEPEPPSNCTSMDTGKLWSLAMLWGVCPWIMMPLLRKAQPAPPSACSPTNRYSTRSR